MINHKTRCLVCGTINPDTHHVLSRGAGGDDSQSNLALLCRKHHTEIHSIGTTTFSNKYPLFKNWLIANGWQYNDYIQKWRLNRKLVQKP